MRKWVAIPNFVDTDRFRPCRDAEEQRTARRAWGVPEHAFVVGCVAALKRDHKRLDYLIREVGEMDLSQRRRDHGEEGFLLLVGATTPDTGGVDSLGREVLPGRHRVVRDAARNDMPGLYRCMDVFVLPSLFEMMPIAVLEAMASGVPVIANRHPVLEWMVGAEDRGQRAGGTLSHRGPAAERSARCGAGTESTEAESRARTVTREERNGCSPGSLCRAWSDGAAQQEVSGRIPHPSPGGCCIDMSKEGELARTLTGLTPEGLREFAEGGRRRSVAVFSKPVVIAQYIAYYRRVLTEAPQQSAAHAAGQAQCTEHGRDPSVSSGTLSAVGAKES